MLSPCSSALDYLKELWQCSVISPSLPSPFSGAGERACHSTSGDRKRWQVVSHWQDSVVQTGVNLPLDSWRGSAERVPGKHLSDI